jgi:nucleotide-binding universal stress UspA family protein
MSRATPGVDPARADFDVLHARHPAHELARYVARQDDVGMVAMATRGLSARQRLVHHSTTFDVARHAAVPVLALHEQ